MPEKRTGSGVGDSFSIYTRVGRLKRAVCGTKSGSVNFQASREEDDVEDAEEEEDDDEREEKVEEEEDERVETVVEAEGLELTDDVKLSVRTPQLPSLPPPGRKCVT
jgi:hypothetical protein